MSDAASNFAALIAERARRQQAKEAEAARAAAEAEAEARAEEQAQAELGERYRAIAAALRATLYDKQMLAFVRDPARRIAQLCTRRAGKTFGGLREFAAFALDIPKSRQLYINETRAETKRLAWDEPDDGLLAVLAGAGLRRGDKRGDDADFWANETELVIRFRNGSIIQLFGADDERQINKLRGGKWHRIWPDEAQKTPHLQTLVQSIAGASLADFDGQLWISGTPSLDTAGYFFEVTRQDGQPRAPGWSVHEWSVVDNPFFGATPEERWAKTAGRALVENGWTEEEPTFRREWLGQWVTTDANFVYPVHAVDPRKLTFAPVRFKEGALSDGVPVKDLYDHKAARADLPKDKRGHDLTWLYSVGLDFGYDPDGFSVSVLAFSLKHEKCFEMYSWKKTKTDTYEQKDRLKHVVDQIDAEGDALASIVGDPAGTRGLLKGWRERAMIPIEEAEKQHKDTWIDLFCADIRRGLFVYREGSVLLDEHRHLVWLPLKLGKRVAHKHRKLLDGRVPGDHAADGTLYAWRHASNWLAKVDPPPPSTPEAKLAADRARLNAEAERYERMAEEQSRAVVAQQAWEADPWATEGWEL